MVPASLPDAHHASPDAETLAWLRLLLTPGLGRATARRLLARAGGAEAIWQLPLQAWAECATQAQIKALSELPADWDKHCNVLRQWLASPAPGTLHTVIQLGSSQYPDCLLHTEDPPVAIYPRPSLPAFLRQTLVSLPCRLGDGRQSQSIGPRHHQCPRHGSGTGRARSVHSLRAGTRYRCRSARGSSPKSIRPNSPNNCRGRHWA